MLRRCAVGDLLDRKIEEPRTGGANTTHHLPLAPFELGECCESDLVGKTREDDRQSLDVLSRHLRNMRADRGLPQQRLRCRRAQKGDEKG